MLAGCIDVDLLGQATVLYPIGQKICVHHIRSCAMWVLLTELAFRLITL